MKAISYQGPHKMSVSTHAKPKIKNPSDATQGHNECNMRQ
jgi:hypothetical protein